MEFGLLAFALFAAFFPRSYYGVNTHGGHCIEILDYDTNVNERKMFRIMLPS